ncbi:MAG: hypothetical protein IH956_04270, partial [Chloroflexi bacterium]|nr:hypothetical protein [Chloroflexota bacterium]
MAEDKMGRDRQSGTGGGESDAAGTASDRSTAATRNGVRRQEAQRGRISPFGQMLVEAGVMSEEQVGRALEAAQREREPLGQILVRDGLIMSRDLATLTALHLGLPLVDLRNEEIEPEAVVLLPQDIARRYLVLAIKQSDSRLTVAMTDPTDLQAIQDLTTRTGYTIEPVIAAAEDIQENID